MLVGSAIRTAHIGVSLLEGHRLASQVQRRVHAFAHGTAADCAGYGQVVRPTSLSDDGIRPKGLKNYIPST